jgi:hypothetical protein
MSLREIILLSIIFFTVHGAFGKPKPFIKNLSEKKVRGFDTIDAGKSKSGLMFRLKQTLEKQSRKNTLNAKASAADALKKNDVSIELVQNTLKNQSKMNRRTLRAQICPSGWQKVSNACFLKKETLVSWDTAYNYCKDADTRSNLLIIDDEMKNAQMNALWAGSPANTYFWIAGTKSGWKNRDGSYSAYTDEQFFVNGGASRASIYHNYVRFKVSSSEWDFVTNDQSYGFVCEISLNEDDSVEEPEEKEEYSWISLGYGGCDKKSIIKKLGTANNVNEAKEQFLSDPDCNFHEAILMYSGYSYAPSWGFYCCSPDAVQGSNQNWSLYQLSKAVNNNATDSGAGSDDITCHSSCATCDGPDSADCVTCPEGTELIDSDNDGAGECVVSGEDITCHSSCVTCDGSGPADCVTCPEGTELFDHDNDGAGECVEMGEGSDYDYYGYDYGYYGEDNVEFNSWISLGYGGCDKKSIIKKLGTANNVNEDKEQFLSDPDCNFDEAILMYSGYSYAPSWGFYCCSRDAVQGSNRNWSLYQLVKSSPTEGATYVATGLGGMCDSPLIPISTYDECEYAANQGLLTGEENDKEELIWGGSLAFNNIKFQSGCIYHYGGVYFNTYEHKNSDRKYGAVCIKPEGKN